MTSAGLDDLMAYSWRQQAQDGRKDYWEGFRLGIQRIFQTGEELRSTEQSVLWALVAGPDTTRVDQVRGYQAGCAAGDMARERLAHGSSHLW